MNKIKLFRKFSNLILIPIILIQLILPFFFISALPISVAQDAQDQKVTILEEEDIISMGVQWTYTRPDNSPAGNSTSWKLRWSPDGVKIAVVYFDNTVIILNSETGKVIKALGTSASVIMEPEKSVTSRRPSDNTGSRCWGYSNKPSVPILRACEWSPDGKLLAVAGDHRRIEIFNTSTWEPETVLEGHDGSVLALAWSPDGARLASGEGTDQVLPHNQADCKNYIKIWNTTTYEGIQTLKGHKDSIISVSWSENCSRLMSASDDRNLKMWDLNNGSEIFTLGEGVGHSAGVLDVDWSPNQTLLVSGSRDFKIRIWDARTGTPLGKPWKDHNCVRSTHWHPSGKYIATAGVDQTLKIRDAGTGKEIKIFHEAEESNSEVMSARWSPDGSAIAACTTRDATVRLYAIGFEIVVIQEPEWVVGVSVFFIICIIGLVVIFLPLRSELQQRRK